MKDLLANLYKYVGFFVGYLPVHFMRTAYYRDILKCKIGKNISIYRHYQTRKGEISIGDSYVISENALLLDGNEEKWIGDNVIISSKLSIYSLQHDYNHAYFSTIDGAIIIEDNYWNNCNSIIPSYVTTEEDLVLGVMCLVNKDIHYKLNYHKTFY
ncbi:hypothetical protein N5J50_05910 [Acinetobacter johnsonii]|uniref:Uncharacterized protein n=1 Tax=Acinetobacter johnsonii TaxID=40214 RepID=A0AA42XCF3_ACIJO|nr:hypothetical protein [Acinetobacter johnsonii]MDH2171770.1 hypothetical protein [Acinetobacter johnsonii]MDH2175223.1 hypothetical protein [Acinetobacter johnsonii]